MNVIVPFALVDPAVAPPDQIWVRATFATEYIDPAIFGANGWDGSGPDGGFLRGETEDWLVSVADLSIRVSPSGRIVPPLPPVDPLPPLPKPSPEPVKGIEKDPVPDITQQGDECGPTSVANSLYYLGKACGFSDKLPGSPDNRETAGPLIEELKKKMVPGFQEPFSGVDDEEFIKGKKDVIKQLGLPIDIHCQNDDDPKNPKKPTKEFIMKELDKCEDVELGVTFTDAKGGGHWVTVVGYTLYPDGSMRLKIHDPDESAMKGDEYYWVGGPDKDGFIYLRQYGRPNKIDIVCAESPTPTPTPTPPPEEVPAITSLSFLLALLSLFGLAAIAMRKMNKR